ncbi:MAG: FeoA family protein [bacterium]
MAQVPLHTLLPKEKGKIHSISTALPSLRQRLLEMGLTSGSAVEFVRTAPLGDPVEILIRGYRLSLRKQEAESVLVEKAMS